ncbi:hypothetical protein [Actinophytocola sp. KF-1]
MGQELIARIHQVMAPAKRGRPVLGFDQLLAHTPTLGYHGDPAAAQTPAHHDPTAQVWNRIITTLEYYRLGW